MLRLETETGWWLVTHVDHANLAGAFAAKWGNHLFCSPQPRAHVLKGISRHDDGWRMRDAEPQITRAGKPSAFSVELVGKYSAFEEIDLADYLSVRERAVRMMAEEDAYAAILVSMHTYNLLADRADRSTIAPDQLQLLDDFLARQKKLQQQLRERIAAWFSPDVAREEVIVDHFRLLQATDNLSLLACLDYRKPATLLHPLPLQDGGSQPIAVHAEGERTFVLEPYPFAETPISFTFPARHIPDKTFSTAGDLQRAFADAPVSQLRVTLRGQEM
jgi:hypothetical protein